MNRGFLSVGIMIGFVVIVMTLAFGLAFLLHKPQSPQNNTTYSSLAMYSPNAKSTGRPFLSASATPTPSSVQVQTLSNASYSITIPNNWQSMVHSVGTSGSLINYVPIIKTSDEILPRVDVQVVPVSQAQPETAILAQLAPLRMQQSATTFLGQPATMLDGDIAFRLTSAPDKPIHKTFYLFTYKNQQFIIDDAYFDDTSKTAALSTIKTVLGTITLH